MRKKMSLLSFRKYIAKYLFLLTLVIAILFSGCTLKETSKKSQEASNRVDKVNCDNNELEASSSQLYFPPNIFSDVAEDNQFIVDWYTSYLKAMKEPSLYERRKSANIEIYRYLVIFPFSPPIMIRLQRCDDKYLVVKKKVTGDTKANPGIVKELKEKELSEIEWRHCTSYLDKVQFWTLPLEQKEPPPDDGIQWVLEGVRKGKYHIINRHTPSTEFKECFNYLLELANSVDDKEIVFGEERPAKQ